MNKRDDEFSKRLAATLHDSVDTLDADTRARLVIARQAALARGRSRRIAGGLVLAASLVALIMMPRLLHQFGPEAYRMQPALQSPLNGGPEDMAYLSVDPQMLDDMDMLQGMDELQSDGDLAPAADHSRGES